MTSIIKKQDEVFKEIKDQNNFLLGFIGIIIGIILAGDSFIKNYFIPYLGIILSFSFSLYGFYLSTNPLSTSKQKNKKRISSLTWIVRLSIGFLFISILIFSALASLVGAK
jgi:hypothetical protein